MMLKVGLDTEEYVTFSDLQMHYPVTFHVFGGPSLQIPWVGSAALQFQVFLMLL